MKREDIIRMAREAGMHHSFMGWTTGDDPDCEYPECVYTDNLERFAELVAKAEREECATIADCGRDPRPATNPDVYLPGVRTASLKTAEAIAATIRARGAA